MLPIKRRQKRKPAHKLEPEVVVAVVLHSPNREIAADKLGVNGGNLRRLMQRDAYRAAFEEAKRALLEDVINQLRVFGGEAVRALRDVMNEPINPPATCRGEARPRRACSCVGSRTRQVEGGVLMNLLRRVRDLEQRHDGKPLLRVFGEAMPGTPRRHVW